MLNLASWTRPVGIIAERLRQVRQEQAADARRVSATFPAQEGIAAQCSPQCQTRRRSQPASSLPGSAGPLLSPARR